MKLSEKAWKASEKIICSIEQHPFNIKMAEGSLDENIFMKYLKQDIVFLDDYSRFFLITTARSKRFIRHLLGFALETIQEKDKIIKEYFEGSTYDLAYSDRTCANINYTNFLYRACHDEHYTVSYAALLPCFWIYGHVATTVFQNNYMNNRRSYKKWISVYVDKKFQETVHTAVNIFDLMADIVDDGKKEKMLNAFIQGCNHELNFWDDCYHNKTLNNL